MLADNLAAVREKILLASQKAVVQQNVKLVAVTKNHPVEMMQEAIDCGVTAIGENRIQEALEKQLTLNRTVEWHLIGHLQTNKVKQAVSLFTFIHSVDSEKLAVQINKYAGKINKIQNILLQVNVAQEETKFGIAVDEVRPLAEAIEQLPNLRLCGMMTIAPYFENGEQTRPIFKKAYQLFNELKQMNLPSADIRWLSMGMTNDYVIAIEEGANLVRVGTGIFGARQY